MDRIWWQDRQLSLGTGLGGVGGEVGLGDLGRSDGGHVEGVREDGGVNCSQTGHRLLWEG